jgi:periplasmic divalent cation tolerance protein
LKIAFVTAPPAEAHGLARRAVEAGVAACVNVVRGVTSHYRWQGEHHVDDEVLLIAKVAEDQVDEFVARVRDWHSYSCPEVILAEVAGGNPEYISWVESSTRNASRDDNDQGSM